MNNIIYDFVGQDLKEGDYVIASTGKFNKLKCFKVIKFTDKMVRIVDINAKTYKQKKGILRYSDELFKIDEKTVLVMLLKRINNNENTNFNK